MRYLCGHARRERPSGESVLESLRLDRDIGSESSVSAMVGVLLPPFDDPDFASEEDAVRSGCVLVGAVLMTLLIKCGTDLGVTPSTN